MNYIKNLPKDAKRIPNTINWIDKKGNLYGKETRILTNRWNGEKYKHPHYGEFFKYKTIVNSHNGYVYSVVKFIQPDGTTKKITKRVHKLVAQAFIENPDNLPIVGHRNNIKNDNRVENLYWTTLSENTQKAVNDGLLVNDKGYADSQSQPVYMYNTYTNELIGSYGSCNEAERETGIAMATIIRQAKYHRPVRKPFYFRFQDDKSNVVPKIVIEYDFKTDKELGRYCNTWEAERRTGISSKSIQAQCKNKVKPHWTKSGTYFLYS